MDCCLGRLTKLAMIHGVKLHVAVGEDYRDGGVEGDPLVPTVIYDGESDVLPTAVRLWAGMVDSAPVFEHEPSCAYLDLADLNDSGLSFKQIADCIEWCWEDL